MDLAFTPEELAFREEIRAWVKANLPADISQKVHSAMRLTRDDLQRWAKILGKKGWLGHGWPSAFGGPGWNSIQKHLFEEECALAGAPRVVPFGPVMVAPVIMAFGNAEQQQRFLPGIASGEVWWSQGYSEPGSGSDLASLKTRAERVGDKYIVNGQKTWTTLGQYGEWIFCLVRTSTEGKPQTGISFLLIDMATPGITVRPINTIDGFRHVNEVLVRMPSGGMSNRGLASALTITRNRSLPRRSSCQCAGELPYMPVKKSIHCGLRSACSTSPASSSVRFTVHCGSTPACTNSQPSTCKAMCWWRTQSSQAAQSGACRIASSVSPRCCELRP